MGGYVKIYGSILGSSIWSESLPTRIVWITMLALADEHGHVEASVSGLARYANVSVGQCRAALVALSEPDTDSKSREFEGRRIANAERGWVILNYLTYREMRSPKQVAEAERKAQWRSRIKDNGDTSRQSPEIRTAVAVAVDEAVKGGELPAPSASQLLLKIKNLAQSREVPGQSAGRFIPRADVEKLGPMILTAYDAIGGADAVLKTPGEKWSFLVRDFERELRAAQ